MGAPLGSCCPGAHSGRRRGQGAPHRLPFQCVCARVLSAHLERAAPMGTSCSLVPRVGTWGADWAPEDPVVAGGDLPSGNLPSAAPSSAQAALPCAVPLLAGSPTRPVMTAVPPTPALDLAKACCRTEIWDCCVFLGASPFIDVNSFLEFLATFPASR